MRRRLIGLFVVFLLTWGGVAVLASQGIGPRLGLDLEGGTSVVLTAPEGTEQEVLEVAVEVMRARIEAVGGVQEPEIQISGANTVLVQLPGVEDERQALEAIGQTGLLTFRPVIAAYPGDVGPYGSAYVAPDGAEPPAGDPPPGLDPTTGLSTEDLPERELFLPSESTDFLSGGAAAEVLHLGQAELLGSDVAQAVPGFDTNRGQWVVSLDLTGEGAGKFAELTGEAARAPNGSPQRQIAIVLDGEVMAAPAVNPDVQPGVGIQGGQAQITLGTSGEDEAQAKNLAVVLRYGSLPVSFEQSQVSKVSATLGTDSLRIGLIAGLAGLILVAAVLLAYYRALGLIAIVGLTVFGSALVALFSLFGELQGLTLTLAGVTGIIVSVGITADSYIVYFERIKDEIRAGKTVHSALDDGFRAAFRTILTADTVSLLGATLLWILAVGPVKGFALSLGMATILDIFVARVYTRRAAWVIGRTRLGDGGGFSIAGAAGRIEGVSA